MPFPAPKQVLDVRGGDATQVLMEGLQAGRLYAFHVAAYNDAGRSQPSLQLTHAMHGEETLTRTKNG